MIYRLLLSAILALFSGSSLAFVPSIPTRFAVKNKKEGAFSQTQLFAVPAFPTPKVTSTTPIATDSNELKRIIEEGDRLLAIENSKGTHAEDDTCPDTVAGAMEQYFLGHTKKSLQDFMPPGKEIPPGLKDFQDFVSQQKTDTSSAANTASNHHSKKIESTPRTTRLKRRPRPIPPRERVTRRPMTRREKLDEALSAKRFEAHVRQNMREKANPRSSAKTTKKVPSTMDTFKLDKSLVSDKPRPIDSDDGNVTPSIATSYLDRISSANDGRATKSVEQQYKKPLSSSTSYLDQVSAISSPVSSLPTTASRNVEDVKTVRTGLSNKVRLIPKEPKSVRDSKPATAPTASSYLYQTPSPLASVPPPKAIKGPSYFDQILRPQKAGMATAKTQEPWSYLRSLPTNTREGDSLAPWALCSPNASKKKKVSSSPRFFQMVPPKETTDTSSPAPIQRAMPSMEATPLERWHGTPTLADQEDMFKGHRLLEQSHRQLIPSLFYYRPAPPKMGFWLLKYRPADE